MGRRRNNSVCVFIVILSSINGITAKEKCSNCVSADECQTYRELNKEEQGKWLERFVCESDKKNTNTPLGFSSTAKGDLVCCPLNVWGVEPANQDSYDNKQEQSDFNRDSNNNKDVKSDPNQDSDNNNEQKPDPDLSNRGGFNQPNQNYTVAPVNTEDNTFNGNNDYDAASDYDSQRGPYWGRGQAHNPYFLPANSGANSGNSFRGNSKGQCSVTSFPPDPATGCCGVEASDDDKIYSVSKTPQNPYFGGSGNKNVGNNWMPQLNFGINWPSWMSPGKRKKREENVDVSIDNRIAGGKETDLEQFPWTVLLKTTFVYPTKEAAFACGGSLISSKYVLTAGHCVFDAEGSIKGIEVTLAEYDKRTFPKDCKLLLGRGEICVENIVMQAEDYVLHPEYDDIRLNNDIAVVRLQGIAPYTKYIRPICLPPLDIDSPDLSNLRLAVAGWGRNGQYKSDIKQSTVVNLVPQRECKKSYPNLMRKHICAAGYSGEDTCKGDSGGPLMMKYNGKYYLSGVVSGKRADAPCGTSVPSLYTNVYQYVPWIRSVIKN